MVKYRELTTEIIGYCVLRLRSARVNRFEFIDVMCDIFMRTIIAYCQAMNLDAYETLRLFHEKNEEISSKGYEAAKFEMECKRTGAS